MAPPSRDKTIVCGEDNERRWRTINKVSWMKKVSGNPIIGLLPNSSRLLIPTKKLNIRQLAPYSSMECLTVSPIQSFCDTITVWAMTGQNIVDECLTSCMVLRMTNAQWLKYENSTTTTRICLLAFQNRADFVLALGIYADKSGTDESLMKARRCRQLQTSRGENV